MEGWAGFSAQTRYVVLINKVTRAFAVLLENPAHFLVGRMSDGA